MNGAKHREEPMEIGPIPGLSGVGAVEARRKVLAPPAIFDMEGAAKPSDGTVERAGRKAEGAEEGEEEDLGLDEEKPPEEGDAQRSVDYFA